MGKKQLSKSQRLLSLAEKLREEGDEENSLFLRELANDPGSMPSEGGKGLNDSEMSLFTHKLRSALKDDGDDGDE